MAKLEIMSLTTENLAQQQHAALKAHVLKVLDTVRDHIKNDRYDKVDPLTTNSPAGDGYGDDNDYIDFGYDGENSADILDVCKKLEYLQKVAKGVRA